MASSQDRAISLKNNYVAGLIEAGATGPMPTMPEQNLGERAGTLINLDNRTAYSVNDGNPRVVVTDGDRMSVQLSPGPHAHPILNNGLNVNQPEGMVRQRFVDDAGFNATVDHLYGREHDAKTRDEPNTVKGSTTHERYQDAMTKPFSGRYEHY